MAPATSGSGENIFKDYRNKSYIEKSKILVDINEVKIIEKKLEKQQIMSKKGVPPDPRLFEEIHYRIYKILKQNYLPEFY